MTDSESRDVIKYALRVKFRTNFSVHHFLRKSVSKLPKIKARGGTNCRHETNGENWSLK